MQDWPKESFCPIHPKKRIITESQFDFSNEGFPHELYRVGGANTVREYSQRREQTTEHNSDDDKSTDSDRSLKIYEKAYACFKPEPGESNAESAERHRLIDERVFELKQEPQRKINPKTQTRIQNPFATSPLLRNTISCRLDQPKLHFKGGGTYTMHVNKCHHILNITPIKALTTTPHKEILLHRREPYDPPTFHNHSTMTQNTNRPNTKTPTAFIYHLRFACASEVVLKRTQGHVIGMEVQLGSWDKLKDNIPCDACLAGKMRKTRKAQSSAFTPVKNLALSWTPNTDSKIIIPNKNISTDWGIISKTLQAGQNIVFALYLDLNTGWVAAYPKLSRGKRLYWTRHRTQRQWNYHTINENIHDEITRYLQSSTAHSNYDSWKNGQKDH
jgi:hypothetical protein